MKPTEVQKQWLASVCGPEVWGELLAHADFRVALETSIAQSHQMMLRYLANKERVIQFSSALHQQAA